MKPKIGLLSLLVLLLVAPSLALAASTHISVAVNVDAANDIGANSYGVISSFVVTNILGGQTVKVTKFKLDGTLGGGNLTAASAQIDSVEVWIDNNRDGKLQRLGETHDTCIGTASGFGSEVNNTYITLTSGEQVNIPDAQVQYFLVVLKTKPTLTDGKVTNVGVTVYDGATPTAGDVALAAGLADNIAIVATHLKWVAGEYYPKLNGTSTNFVKASANMLKAVDDYDNVDAGFGDTVRFGVYSYNTLDNLTADATFLATNGAGADIKSNQAVTSATFVGGLLVSTSASVAGAEVKSIKYTNASYANVPIILVAQTVTYKLEGSVTVYNGTTYPVQVPALAVSRGIEVYDTDRNGHIDHVTMFFNVPVAVGTATNNDFTVGGGYLLSGAPVTNFDAGGTGIKNAGEYGVTLTLTEKMDTYDTAVTPDVQFSGGANKITDIGGSQSVVSWASAQAVEVDRARPILIDAYTRDTGIGAGEAKNGLLDGIEFVFSEPIRNVSAGTDTTGVLFYINQVQGTSFNQGSGSSSESKWIVPLAETSPNTGLTPTIIVNDVTGATVNRYITDFAKTAAGAFFYNRFFPDNTDYSDYKTLETRDGAPMVVSSVRTRDIGAAGGGGTGSTANNGKLDAIEVIFSENAIVPGGDGVQFFTDVAGFSSTNNGLYTIEAGIGGSGASYTFKITESTSTTVFDSEALPKFAYEPSTGKITDSAGNALQKYGIGAAEHPATVDGIAPVVVKVLTQDAYTDTSRYGNSSFEAEGADGRVDGVKVIFSEKVMTPGGAHFDGATTQRDNTIDQFTITHALTASEGLRVLLKSAEAFGKPTWADKSENGDTWTELTIYFKEASNLSTGMKNGGDTGMLPTVAYAPSATTTYNIKDYSTLSNNLYSTIAAGNIKDGAKPFLISGITNGWGAEAFSNIITFDVNADVDGLAERGRTGENDGNGNGYLEGFELRFSEVINSVGGVAAAGPYTGANVKYFVADTLFGDQTITFDDATAKMEAKSGDASIWYITGINNKKGGPNTGVTPTLKYTYNDAMIVKDSDGNKLATFDPKPSYDGAAPVVYTVNRGATDRDLVFTFSEQIWGHYSNGVNCPVDSINVASNTLFGYENTGTPTSASGFTSAIVTQIAANQLNAKLNADLIAGDIKNDLVWIRMNALYDNANANESGLADNLTTASTSGTDIKIAIFDDVVAPWIIGAWTVDADGNGLVDHIKIQFSEAMKDTLAKGYISQNTMSNDVSASWKLSGYNGTLRWNFFNNDNAGKKASIAAGKPVFSNAGTNLAVASGYNDDIMYLELEEDKAPVYSISGYGSTGWVPTITWGTGTNAPGLGDLAKNVLDVASTVTSPSSLAATNGAVIDDVQPVIMKAVYASGKTTLYFSEAISDTAKSIECDTFLVLDTYAFICDNRSSSYNISTGASKHATALGGKLWLSPGVLEIPMLSSWTWDATKAYGIQISNAVYTAECLFKDSRVQDTKKEGLEYAADPYSPAKMYYVYNEFCPTPYKDLTCYDTHGLVLIEGVSSIALTSLTSATTTKAGVAVDVKWSSTLVDSVDVYQSTDYGVTFTMIPGSRTAASANKYVWTATSGVDKLRIVSATDATIKATSAVLTILGGTGGDTGLPIAAPTELALKDVPGDNGHWFIATFKPVTDSRVKSYQFYREMTFALTDTTSEKQWVYSAVVPKTAVGTDGMARVLVPSVVNGTMKWAVAASSGDVVSDFGIATKESDEAVAMLVEGAAKAADGMIVSALSEAAEGGAIDNIAPSPITVFAADDNEGANTGVLLSWTAPEDHGIVGYYGWAGVGQHPIYGVEKYEVYRKAAGSATYELVGFAGPLSTSYIDAVKDASTVYSYYVKATDLTNAVETKKSNAMAFAGGADFTSDGVVGLGDLVLFGSNWAAKKTDATWVSAFDLNKDGEVGLGDLVLLGSAWSQTSKAAKALPMSNDVALGLTASYDQTTATYILNISASEVEGLNGLGLTLSYDTEALQLVNDGISGLGTVNVTRETEPGMLSINSYFKEGEFNGGITIAFTSKGTNKDLNFELVDASVAINSTVSAVSELANVTLNAVPTVYSLAQNFPNPFNPTTTIEYSIPQSGNVSLVIYNMAGQKVRTLVNENQSAAFKKVVWDGKNELGESVAAGLYFYKLVSGNFTKIQKMTLIK
ncbi:T9SS type A sorting domain-containing protein [bacterium]|nr:T9SS type A sorting domain-containing protein [bacterium]